MAQNTSYFVPRSFAEKPGFRLIHGGNTAFEMGQFQKQNTLTDFQQHSVRTFGQHFSHYPGAVSTRFQQRPRPVRQMFGDGQQQAARSLGVEQHRHQKRRHAGRNFTLQEQ